LGARTGASAFRGFGLLLLLLLWLLWLWHGL
jgi:hypothetical protein